MSRLVIGLFLVLLGTGTVVGVLATQSDLIFPQNTPERTPTPEPTETEKSTSTSTPATSPEPSPTTNYSTVTFKWYLKPEFINNVTWLNQTWGYVSVTADNPQHSQDVYYYNETLSWTENYVDWLAAQKYYWYADPLMPGENVFKSALINLETGFTTAVYLYRADNGFVDQDYGHHYMIMNHLEAFGTHNTIICDARGFTITYE